MDEEAADKLIRGELHRFMALVGLGAVVGPLEVDTALIATQEPSVGDGHAMGIPRQVGQHRLWTREGTFGIDDPFHASGGRQVTSEGRRVCQVLELPVKRKASVCTEELFKEPSSEQSRQYPDRQEEPLLAG